MALREPSPASSTASLPLRQKEGDTWTNIIDGEIDARHAEISNLNQRIHSNPELAYEEHKAHDAFVTHLRYLNFEVTPRAYGLDTAFSAEYGTGGRLIIYNAEYDALPGIGHACGHNLIASAAFASFLGVAAALKRSGRPGRVRLLGTPAEEGGGGKLKLLAAGAYKGADASLMVHPGPGHKLSGPIRGVSYVRMLANVKMRVYFTGKEAHAAIAPWDGVNALDAVCLSYNAIAMLRQQIRPYERIHGVFRSAGDRPNVTPANCCVEYYVRSDTRAHAQRLWERVEKCFEGAAIATGCEVRSEALNSYADVRPSTALCRAFVDAMPAGTIHYDEPADFLAGSTDMGDVTYACPGFHGAFGIDTKEGEANHTKGFATAAGTKESFERAIEWGKGMALVGWKVLTDDQFAAEMKQEWEADMKKAAE
jgi:amidohydrolase